MQQEVYFLPALTMRRGVVDRHLAMAQPAKKSWYPTLLDPSIFDRNTFSVVGDRTQDDYEISLSVYLGAKPCLSLLIYVLIHNGIINTLQDLTLMGKRIDGVLGIRTQDCRMVGADESTELLSRPHCWRWNPGWLRSFDILPVVWSLRSYLGQDSKSILNQSHPGSIPSEGTYPKRTKNVLSTNLKRFKIVRLDISVRLKVYLRPKRVLDLDGFELELPQRKSSMTTIGATLWQNVSF